MANLQDFVHELKRRRVIRALVGWGIVAFAVLQVVEPILHAYHLPDWTLTSVVTVLGLGFPVTAILAWAFDLTARGITRTTPVAGKEAGGFRLSGARLAALLVGLGAVAAAPGLIYFFAWPGVGRSGEGPGASSAGSAVPSIAVLPFTDMSPEKDQEYLADGLAEEILNALAQLEGLNVAGRTSSFSFKGRNEDLRSVGQKLNVAAILEGSVRKSGSKIRITAQIIKAADGFHLWSKTFDRELTDIFAVQDEIAHAVVEALQVRLLPGRAPSVRERQTSSPEAYEQYLRGVELLSRYGFAETPRAQAAFEKAIALDSGYGLAWSELSMALALLSDWASDAERPSLERRALAAADKGVELAPDLADSWARRAILRMQIQWDWAAARADIDRALILNPRDVTANEAQARLLAVRGQLAEAIVAGRRVVELDRLNVAGWLRLHTFYVGNGQAELARGALERAEAIAPASFNVLWARAYVDLGEGRPASALAISRRLEVEGAQELGQDGEATPLQAAWLVIAARARHALGQAAESQRALETLTAKYGEFAAYQVAEIYAIRGEKDQAFEWLERAWRQRDGGLVAVLPWVSPVKWNPAFRDLRPERRYAELVLKMNLPAE